MTHITLRRRWTATIFWWAAAVALIVLTTTLGVEGATQQANKAREDLYKILGVDKTATTKEIKSAYRRKALDTHPDKNKEVPAEEAAQAFQRVVSAFEVLSDDKMRKIYDAGGDPRKQQQQQHQWHRQNYQQFHRSSGGFTFTFQSSSSQQQRRRQQQQQQQQRPPPRKPQRHELKDTIRVKEAQSRVMHINNLNHLKNVMLDDNGRLERNLLICFVTSMNYIEEMADDEMLFPFPFAAMSSQGIWWEDLIQTVKIRFEDSGDQDEQSSNDGNSQRNTVGGNDLFNFFGIRQRLMQTPVVYFAKRGSPLNRRSFSYILPKNRDEFEQWAWKQLHVKVGFVNNHTHAVELVWLNQDISKLQQTLEPGENSKWITTMLSHEFFVRDARVDTRSDSPERNEISENSMLGRWKILSDKQQQLIEIEAKTCYDLSGHCYYWHRDGECDNNPVFMEEQCAKTCGVCTEGETDDADIEGQTENTDQNEQGQEQAKEEKDEQKDEHQPVEEDPKEEQEKEAQDEL